MTTGLADLRLAEALAEQRLEAARRTPIAMPRRQSTHGVPTRKRIRHGGVVLQWPAQLHRPAHGVAGH